MNALVDSRRRVSSRWRRAGVLLAVAAALSLAACSSSSSSSSTSSGTAASTSGSASGSGLSAADQAGLAKAQALVASQTQEPSAITDTVKITKPIPTGLTIDFVPCGSPECTLEGAIVKKAASLVGWNTVVLSNDGTPQGDKAAFAQVVRNKAAAVLYTAIP